MILLRLQLRRSDRGCLKPHSPPLRPQAPTQIDAESSRRQQGTAKGSPEGDFFLGISVPVSEMELGNLQKRSLTTHHEQNTPQERAIASRDKAKPCIIEREQDDADP